MPCSLIAFGSPVLRIRSVWLTEEGLWQVNALPLDEQHGKGRISLVVWGLAQDCIEERDSPSLIVNSRPGHHHHGHQTLNASHHFR